MVNFGNKVNTEELSLFSRVKTTKLNIAWIEIQILIEGNISKI